MKIKNETMADVKEYIATLYVENPSSSIANMRAAINKAPLHYQTELCQIPADLNVFTSERPPAKAGGFGLRLKAGSVRHPAD